MTTTTIDPAIPAQRTPSGTTAEAVTARAVIYLRVSTSAQADTDERDPEGYSIPAQREACRRKAAALGAEVVDEYVDRGESAKTADRPHLKAMLARIRDDGDIDLVVVHKVDRLARNRTDDVTIALAFKAAGVQLVSATENIDDTPSGKLLHGIMASIAEFYSANLASEVIKGSVQKAKAGGTPYQAPVGYLNERQRIDGREVRTVVPDPERAPLVPRAFRAYATGRYATRELLEEMTELGLTMRPGPNRPEAPLSLSKFTKMLHNRYYLGIVTYRGVDYPGRHQPLVDPDLFDQVQRVLAAKNRGGERRRKHPHYLKGSVFCGRCGSRLSITLAKGNGGTYSYFFCLGRQRRNGCDLPCLSVDEVEEAICRYYERHVRLKPDKVKRIRAGLLAELRLQGEHDAREVGRLERRIVKLDHDRLKWSEKVVAGSVPDDIGRAKQSALAQQLVRARAALAKLIGVTVDIETTLCQALDLARDCGVAYKLSKPALRREWNQGFFERLEIDVSDVVGATLAEPFKTLLDDGTSAYYERALGPGTANGEGGNEETGAVLVGVGLSKEPLVQGGDHYSNTRSCLSKSPLVGEGGLEPPHPFGHRNLNPARLPIPPLARGSACQQ
jgi:site-specific DNA recombinase